MSRATRAIAQTRPEITERPHRSDLIVTAAVDLAMAAATTAVIVLIIVCLMVPA